MLRAVLFDLDDTLFDHRGGARAALERVQQAHQCFAGTPFEAFERAHAAHLESLHREVLAGARDIDSARIERFRRLFAETGGDPAGATAAAAVYRQAYVATRRAVAGAHDLLAALRSRTRIGVVSNNLFAEQQEKLRQCGLEPLIDALVVSEEAGVAKPDPRIFEIALGRLAVAPDEAVMVGDSWPADVVGARQAGIVPVWFNPTGLAQPPSTLRAVELRALHPVAEAVAVIVASHAHRH